MLKVKGLSFSYRKKPVVQDLSFCVGEGECLAVAGPNGSGKSTLLSLLAGVLKPNSGEIWADGSVGYVPQGIALFEDMTVRDNLEFFAGLSGSSVPDTLPLDVGKLLAQRVRELSGGMKKCVSIVCAMSGDPKILLLDEPCAGLDLCYREELVSLIFELKRQQRTVIYVGHEPEEFAPFYDRLLLLGGETPALCSKEAVSAAGGLFEVLLRAEKNQKMKEV